MLLFLLFLISNLSFAETRSSMISLSGTQGPDDFKSGSLSSTIGINEDWAAKLSFFQSDSGVADILEEKLISSELRLGGDYQINLMWGVEFGVVGREDPYEVEGRGGYLGGRVVLSDFWGGKRETSLNLRIERMRFTQSLTVEQTLRTYEIETSINQEFIQLGLDQDIFLWWLLYFSHRKYNYSDESSRLVVTSARRRTSFSGSRNNYGLPDNDILAGFQFLPYEWLEINLDTSRTKLVEQDEITKSNSLTTTFLWSDFSLDLSVSLTDFGDASGEDQEKQTFYTIGLAYSW
jgi:hypothetical protein